MLADAEALADATPPPKAKAWKTVARRWAALAAGAEPVGEYLRVMEILAAFTASRTKAELFALARSYNFV